MRAVRAGSVRQQRISSAGRAHIPGRCIEAKQQSIGHYRTFFVPADWAGGEPTVREPDSCEQWAWFSRDERPEPLLLPAANLRATGFRP